ncbi:ATP-dependent DNA helicase [Halalkalirubrum salinum]|uniref:ATP-dependent DNA helicase n=1 Tax=Halalkalirubrum salinum TaxID=2563889 RepID=UPI0010FAFC31|nr:ATP-dependent DNA helicase [Halalkalirubrum salinum]
MTDDLPSSPRLKGNQPNVASAQAEQIVVDAGAGTGKTTTMVARIDRLIDERGVDPNDVLVLTFANKAAHSAVERLTDTIEDASAYDIDASTYHSFCYRLLREYAYAVGLDPEFELLTDDRKRAVIAEIHDGLTLSDVSRDRATADDLYQFIESFSREGISPDDIETHLPDRETLIACRSVVRDLRSTADEQFGPDSDGALAFTSSGGHGRLVERLERFEQVLRYRSTSIDEGDPFGQEVRSYLDDCTDIVRSLIETLPQKGSDWSRVPSGLFGTWGGAHGGTLRDTAQTPIVRLGSYIELFLRAHDFLEGYRRYESRLQERGAVDYNGLIRRATALLESDLGADVCDRYGYVFCDEFQDTDSAQLALIDQLATDADLFVIGDADQAIYEWRGADPTNITDIESAFPGIESMALELNFRSRQPILDLSNELPGSTKTLTSDRGRGERSICTVEADGDLETQAAQVSATVSALLTDGFDEIDGHDLDELAVLVRKNREAEAVCAALAEESIPHVRAGGSSSSLPPGIQTLVAYLRLIVDPSDDRHAIRILKLVYGLSDGDIRALADEAGTIVDAVGSIERTAVSNPDGLTRAREDIPALVDAVQTDSVSAVYAELRERTRIDWTFTDRDRRLLPAVESRIDAFEDAPIETRLSTAFIDYLADPAALTNTEQGRDDGGDRSEDAVDVMTVHQAKGLDFPVVLVPFLGPSWAPPPSFRLWGERTDWSVLRRRIESPTIDPLTEPLSAAAVAEQWRVLHVAITRARDRLVLFGNNDDTATVPAAELDELLPPSIGWRHGGPSVDTWDAVTDAVETIQADDPTAVCDLTTAVEQVRTTTREQITWYDGTRASPDRAITEIRRLTRQLKRGTLTADAPADSPYQATPTAGERADRLPRVHSHTSLEAFGDCPRKHYLDHVVYGFDDPPLAATADRDGQDAVSQRAIGTLFHEVREDCYWRGYTEKAEWDAACERIARQQSLSAAVPATKACIDRYFESVVSEWSIVSSELPFSLDALAARTGADGITGYVDAVYRTPDDDLVVIDYKTTDADRSIEDSAQLVLYLLACDARFDEPIASVGYLSLGESGPQLTLFDRAEVFEQIPELKSTLEAANSSDYKTVTPGPYCQYCPHRSLGCGDAYLNNSAER